MTARVCLTSPVMIHQSNIQGIELQQTSLVSRLMMLFFEALRVSHIIMFSIAFIVRLKKPALLPCCWCSGVVVGRYGVSLSCVWIWCEATLFSALRSSDFCLNIHGDESPFSSHTLWMKLCTADGQRRLRGSGPAVGLFCLPCAVIWREIEKHIKLIHRLCADRFTRRANWKLRMTEHGENVYVVVSYSVHVASLTYQGWKHQYTINNTTNLLSCIQTSSWKGWRRHYITPGGFFHTHSYPWDYVCISLLGLIAHSDPCCVA